MTAKKILNIIMALTFFSAFTINDVNASYTEGEEKTVWDLTDITTDIGYNKTDFQSGTAYSYNGLTLRGGSGADITDKGLIGNKNGGYVEFTPAADGTLDVVADMNAGAILYCDTSVSSRSNVILTASADTAKMSGSAAVTANTTYYIYNGTSKTHKIKTVTYTPTATAGHEEPTAAPEPTATSEPNGRYIHMSFDDVYQCLQDITVNSDSYNSVFDSPFFGFLKEMHTKYNAVFSLYCFNTASGWDISDVTDNFQAELAANSDWIKFGFHAEDADANYGSDDGNGTYGTAKGDCPEELAASYTKFLASVKTLTGNDFESIDHISRLGFFGGTKTNIKTLQSLGMTGFLGADSTSRLSYYLTEASTLYRNGYVEDTDENILFLSSQSRLESVAKAEADTAGSVDAYLTRIENLKDAKVIEIFTHEGRWTEERTKNMIDYYLSWAVSKGYGFGYAQNVYEKYAPVKTAEPVVTEEYDLTKITEKIDYDESAFQSGTDYEYEGLKIIGNNSAAKINSSGVRFTKQAAGQMYFEYVPIQSGTLKVEITAGHSGSYYSAVYADTALGSRKNQIIAASEDGYAYGETEVEAGVKYYIYNASSAPTVFTRLSLLTDADAEYIPELSFNNMYGDNMLLQRGEGFMLKGKYKNISGVKISLVNDRTGETEQSKDAVMNRDLTWSADFNAVDNYSDTYTINAVYGDADTVSIKNVVFGDVFLLGGQSNTVREIGYYKNLGIDYNDIDFTVEMPNIRMLDITGGKKVSGETPAKSAVPCDEFLISDSMNYEIAPEWTAFDKELDYNSVSALAYSFATKLYKNTGVPVGVISTGYDGTDIAQWLPGNSNNLYNSRIYPFRVFNLKAILWYQGESDRSLASPLETYKERFTSLVKHYRGLFANEDAVPFYYVSIPRTSGSATDPQNPEIGASANAKLALIRQAQTEVYTELSKTERYFGIVPTLDIYGNKNYDAPFNGETENGNNRRGFHTGQKPEIAQRLVNWALKDLYNADVNAIGPVYRSGVSRNGRLVLTYECSGDLRLLDKDMFTDSRAAEIFGENNINDTIPQEFEIAGEDGVYYRADAELKGNTVILTSENVAEPVAFRYAHSGYSGDTYIECPNLTDSTGLPALVTAGTVAVVNGYAVNMSLSGNRLTIDSSESISEAVLIKAVFNGDQFVSAERVNGISALNSGVTELDIEAEESGTVKLFLWKSVESLEPLSQPIIIKE